MRYPDSGGLTAQARARREAVRLQAAELFGQGLRQAEVAARLRVSPMSASRWHRAWRSGAARALASKGPGGSRCRLDDAQLQRLADELQAGPAAHGWIEDQRWTLARIAVLIEELFHTRYTLRGVSLLLHRIGFSPQMPIHRAVERDAAAVTTWVGQQWPAGKAPRRPATAGSSSKTRPASS